jgi:hypothetical protein
MKNRLFLFLLFFSSSLLIGQNISQDSTRFKLLKKDLLFLTALEKPRNFKNIESLNNVAAYLKNELKKVCDSVAIQSYNVKHNEYKNVIGSIGLQHKERIIIGAHYDVYGNSEGADDNASGVAGLLELARLLKDVKLTYRIDFAFYTLEEPPFFRTKKMGSYVHAKYLYDENIPVKGMICLESIGYYSDKPNSQEYPIKELASIYGTKGNYSTVVQNDQKEPFSTEISNVMSKMNYIPTKPFIGSAKVPGVDFSDHLNYWRFDYEAVMITNTAFYRNQHYHTSKDTLETLDIERMYKVIQQLKETLIVLYGEK